MHDLGSQLGAATDAQAELSHLGMDLWNDASWIKRDASDEGRTATQDLARSRR